MGILPHGTPHLGRYCTDTHAAQKPERRRERTGPHHGRTVVFSGRVRPRQTRIAHPKAPPHHHSRQHSHAPREHHGPCKSHLQGNRISLLTEMLHKWLSAPQATLEMLRAIEHGAESAPLQPAVSAAAAPAAPGKRATYPLGSSRRHGPCSHGPLRHREVPAGAGARR